MVIALRCFGGTCDEAEWLSSGDRRRALEIAKRLSGGDDEASALLVQWARRMASMILSAHQTKVERLASALESQRKLTAAQASAILSANGEKDCQNIS